MTDTYICCLGAVEIQAGARTDIIKDPLSVEMACSK